MVTFLKHIYLKTSAFPGNFGFSCHWIMIGALTLK